MSEAKQWADFDRAHQEIVGQTLSSSVDDLLDQALRFRRNGFHALAKRVEEGAKAYLAAMELLGVAPVEQSAAGTLTVSYNHASTTTTASGRQTRQRPTSPTR